MKRTWKRGAHNDTSIRDLLQSVHLKEGDDLLVRAPRMQNGHRPSRIWCAVVEREFQLAHILPPSFRGHTPTSGQCRPLPSLRGMNSRRSGRSPVGLSSAVRLLVNRQSRELGLRRSRIQGIDGRRKGRVQERWSRGPREIWHDCVESTLQPWQE